MKYKLFYDYLNLVISQIHNACIGPSISITIGKDPKVSIKNFDFKIKNNFKYIIFPIKIYGENIRHLNILCFDKQKKIIERYEPFNEYLNFYQINDLIESLLYKLMNKSQIYFLKYQTSLNSENIVNDKNCGLYCIQYIRKKFNCNS
ncbi:hypothetical protein IIV30_014R [Invertebrate iridescent virus 30]|uniref:Uncharacterized protein n=1 Tax=Invertebrate iridescent virus 30 TaxID=345585 RepID=W8W2V7_9VIRU|nr:hypothetical protein IIV30_014R [Invertebrate iridescent virus 30]CCV02209.1 hypothetical protein IIV30_014R [Invertebrate iridescent virus 30]